MDDKFSESEAFRTSWLRDAPNPILVFHEDGSVIYVNPALENLTGYSKEEILGYHFPPLWWPEDKIEQYRLQNQQTFKQKTVIEERVFKKKTGELFWVNFSLRQIEEPGKSQYAIANWVDITERKKAEEALRYQAMLVDNVSEAIISTNLDGDILSWNKAAETIYGWKQEEAVGKNIYELLQIIRHTHRAPLKNVESYNRTGFWTGESAHQRRDGTVLSISTSICLIRDPSGNPYGTVGLFRDVTKQKKAEEDLKKSERKFREIDERFQQVAMNAGEWIWEVDDEGIYRYSNPVVENILGYSPHELIGKIHFFDLFQDEMRVDFATNFLVSEFQQPVHNSIRTFIHNSGKPIILEANIVPVKNQDGINIGLRGVSTDITKRKLVEEELTRSKKNFTLAAQLTHLGPWEYDPEKRVFIFNDEFYAILGTSVQREGMTMAPQQYFKEFIHPDDISLMNPGSPRIQALPGLDQANRIEHRIIRRDGQVRYVAVLSRLIRDTTGKVIEWYGANQDITESKLAEEALKESEEKYSQLVEQSNDGIVMIDTRGIIIFVNSKTMKFTGYAQEEILNQSFLQFVVPEQRPTILERFTKRIGGETTGTRYEFTFLKKDQTRLAVEANVSYFKYQGHSVILNILRDISERKQAEEDLKVAAKKLHELLQKEKTQTKELLEEAKTRGMFTDILAHELRTPLTPILASTGMLNELISDKVSIQGKLVANIYTGAKVLSDRLEELLEVAKYSRGTFKLNKQSVATREYLDAVISRFKPSIDQQGQILIVEISENLPAIEIDPSRFEQVIVNLLSNASKFSPRGGHITFRARVQGDELLIEIQDEGIGISPEEGLRIFQPYHRVEQDRLKFPGLGLGLAVSKQIVEAHGGKIWLESQEGQGSTFSLSISVK